MSYAGEYHEHGESDYQALRRAYNESQREAGRLRAELAELKSVPVLETPAPLTKERLDALIESVYSRLPLGTTHEVVDSMILLRNAILGGAPVEPVPAPRLEWREGKAASVGPMTDQITKWHTTTEVTDGKLYWSITWAAEERFVLRVKDDNRTDTVWLGHRSSLDAAKSLAEKLQGVLDERA